MFEPSWEKLLIVLVIALIVLGPKKLPEVGRNLGHSMREFKDGISGNAKDEPAQTPTPPAASIDPPAPATYTAPTAEQSAVHHSGE
jgi:sec-independent protein translocase protein TatA